MFYGWIDNLAMYNGRALTASQVSVHYNLGKVDEGGRVICIPPRSFCMENHEWNLQGGHGDDPTAHG